MSQEKTADGCMKSMFFFDDWLLFAREGLDRMQGRPERVREVVSDFQSDSDLKSIRGLGVQYDQNRSCYVMGVDCHDMAGTRFFTRLESDDPYNWPAQRWAAGKGPLWTRADNAYLDQDNKPLDCFNIFGLEGTPLAERGYVITFWDYLRTHRGDDIHSGKPSAAVGFSQDGIHFNVEKDTFWIPHHSDTGNPVIYNPWTKQYMIFCRPEQTDRRVDIVLTSDFKTFSPSETILQPDAEDPVGREFYGLGAALYDDMFVGMLHIFDTEPTEKAGCRMQGINQMQVAYSYNGRSWYRACREMFIGRGEPGSDSGGSVYASAPIRTAENRLLFSSMVAWTEHGMDIEHCPEEWKKKLYRSYLYELRLDGFMYLRTRARQGLLRSKVLVLQGGDLTVNARTTPSGYVKAVLLDHATYEPIPNYTLEDAIALTGDELFGKLRWRERDNLDELKGKLVVLELHVREADLFALRFGYRVRFGEYAHDRV